MRIITIILELAALLEILAWYGLVGSYDIEQISGYEFLKGSAAMGVALYITVKLTKVSAVVTANNNRRKKTVKSHKINRFQHTTKSGICQAPVNQTETPF